MDVRVSEATASTAPVTAPGADALKVFISYSRVDMAAADRMVADLERNGFSVTIDRRDLPYGEEWQKELASFIAASDTVVWLVSPASVKSKWVNWELGEVGRLSKRLLPVKVAETDPATLPEALGRIHLLPAEGVYEASRHEADLVRALNTDRAWLKKATSLGEDAREWLAANRDGAHLLRGRALAEAEAWSVRPPRDVPAPASEILELILASRRGQDRRRRMTVTGSVAAAVIALGLAATAVWFGLRAAEQATEAERQSALAQAEQQRAETAAAEALAAQQRAESESRRAEQSAAEANAARERAEAERAAALKAEAGRVATVSEAYLDSGRPDVALALALDVVPTGRDSGVPLTPELESIIRRAYPATPPPAARRLESNAFAVAVSPDGRFVAAGTAGDAGDATTGLVYIFDAKSTNQLARFKASDDIVNGMAFSPDGSLIAVVGGRTPAVWDTQTGQKKFDLKGPEIRGFTSQVQYSADGKLVVIGTNGNVAYAFDGANGELRLTLPGMDFDAILARLAARRIRPDDGIEEAVARNIWNIFGTATEIAISPDGKHIAVTGPANPEGAVQIFDAETGAMVKLLTDGTSSFMLGTPSYHASTLSFSDDSARVVASARGQTIKAWSMFTGELLVELLARDVQSFALSDNGKTLISGHANGNIAFRCLDGLADTIVLRAHDDYVTSVTIAARSGLLASTSQDRTAKLWRLPGAGDICQSLAGEDDSNTVATMAPLAVYAGHGSVVHESVFTVDARSLLTVSKDGFLRFWPIDSAPDPIPAVKGFDFPPDFDDRPDLLLASGDGRTVFVKGETYDEYGAFDLATLKLTDLPEVEGVAPDASGGKGLLFAAPHASWPYGESQPDLDDEARFSTWRAVVSRDGRRAVREDDDRFFLYDTEGRRDIAALAADGRKADDSHYAPDFFFSADGRTLFARGDDDDVGNDDPLYVWNAETGDLLHKVEVLEELNISSFRDVSADGAVLVVSDSEITYLYRVGKTVEAIPIAALEKGGDFGGNPLDLSSDGTKLVRGHPDGRVEVFEIDEGTHRTLKPTTSGVTHLLLSNDAHLVAVVDVARTVTILSLADDRPLNHFRLKSDAAALTFGGDALVILDMLGQINVFPLATASAALTDGRDFVDWLRATRHSTVSAADREQYGLREPNQETRADLDAVAAYPLPPVRTNPAPNEKAAECDRLATNPYDRDRRTNGVRIEEIDPAVALPICQEALRLAPADPQTLYHVGRVFERAGELDLAMKQYLEAAAMDYAAGIRNVGRLIWESPERFANHGPARDWFQRGAKAGDPWALISEATSIAIEKPGGTGFSTALSMLLSTGYEVKSQPFMNLAFWILERGSSDIAIREKALLAVTIGLELYERVGGMTEMGNPYILNNSYTLVRSLAKDMEPARVVELYREALAWRAE